MLRVVYCRFPPNEAPATWRSQGGFVTTTKQRAFLRCIASKTQPFKRLCISSFLYWLGVVWRLCHPHNPCKTCCDVMFRPTRTYSVSLGKSYSKSYSDDDTNISLTAAGNPRRTVDRDCRSTSCSIFAPKPTFEKANTSKHYLMQV